MSIPPLVCSTPPPLEQCEDDKDPEDFDLQYNLSQDDDDNEFGYGNFTTFNSFHTVTKESSKSSPTFKTDSIDLPNNIQNDEEPQITTDEILNHSRETSLEEDINIEDLNLNVSESCTKDSPKYNEVLSSKDTIDDTKHIPCNSSDISQIDCKISSIEKNISSAMTPETPQLLVQNTENLSNEETTECENVSNLKFADKIIVDETSLNALEDDFGDFDEFNFTNSVDTPEVVIDSNNPWENSNAEDVPFGDFTANFGDNENKLSEPSVTADQFVASAPPETQTDTKNPNSGVFDQDFGDFDEFKCSSTEDQENVSVQEPMSSNSVPVLNFQSDNEHQLMESLNKVLQSIFKEEISESNDEICSNLDTSLGETWGYLKETDTRLPYMVNWNNSLAQKTLLKALCIDSRNILFGPKWSSNMPKYAVNLSAAPLMPQKQVTQLNNIQSEQVTNTDKSANKSWVDPFTSDGQESCNADSENTTIEAGPTDLDVFEATIPPKSEKIYSSTLNIQPMRQISLPDTHIFTPTDSETPRSKTIHYDTNHTILMPQQVAVVKTPLDSFSSQAIKNSPPENDEYWEFQNFTASSDTKSRVNQNVEGKNITAPVEGEIHTKPDYTYETQVLQPIKLELTMPTLNWPNPGEVKETFEDFTDFISKTTPDIENPMSLNNHQDNVNKEPLPVMEGNVFQNRSQKSSEQIDDEFDMFQSALPSNSKISQLDTDKPGNGSEKTLPNFDTFFSKQHDVVSSDISDTVPIDSLKQGMEKLPTVSEIKNPVFVKPITNSSLLQPTSITANVIQQNQQKTGQILQPLSLESYSQINWPNPGIDLQDLSRFNPVESLQSFKNDVSNHSKNSSPMHGSKGNNQPPEEDIWGEFVSSVPKPQQPQAKKVTTFVDDDEWTDFVSSPSVNPHNGLNTISFNVHTNSNIQKSTNSSKYPLKSNEIQLDIPTLNYITPKTSSQKTYNERHFQNL